MVKIPFKAAEYDQTKYGILHLVSAFLFAFASNAFAIPQMAMTSGTCSIKSDYQFTFILSYLILNYLCSNVGVGVLLLILTILTIQGLLKSGKVAFPKISKTETRLTQMLIVLVSTFLILRILSTIIWLVLYVPYGLMNQPRDDTFYKLFIAFSFFRSIALSNFAVNFIIYITFWPAFRNRFIHIISAMILRSNRSTS